MKNYDYGYGFKPISAWGYIGYSLLWSIPVVGWIVWLCHALGASNRNVKNYARSYFCAFLLAIIASVVMVALVFILGLDSVIVESYKDVFEIITNNMA